MANTKLSSNAEWLEWGKRDPLWSVASWPGRERGGAKPWSDEEFYALGEDWHDFDEAWRRCGRADDGTVLEIGCGAGRITRMLADTFTDVVATDVSEDMLNYARTRVDRSNIQWRRSDGANLPTEDTSVDAVFSCHVLQHFPDNGAQLRSFVEIHRALRPGGSFFVHIPMHSFPENAALFSRFGRLSYSAYLKIAGMKNLLLRLSMSLGGTPYMRGVSYEMLPLMADLRALGFQNVSVTMVSVRTTGSVHPCIYGRKAQSL